jgi:trehalose-phosphatase
MSGAAPIEAVLFDMDGVITDTATVHAAAWQRLFDEYLETRSSRGKEAFRAFDPRDDYRRHVDGKSRSDGVRSFLASRGIELPEGHPDDPPDRETVAGLGNRKDRYFTGWLAANRVRAYPGTLRLIEELRAAGVRVGMFSASRNAGAVLRNAGILELFDATVDGVDRARLGLPGKPDPATLLEAARRLGVTPGKTAVVEDAIAGVRAGKSGEFGLVVGVGRAGQGRDLARAGADLLVNDLAELRYRPGEGLVLKTLANLPSAWEHEHELRRRLAGQPLAVFLDYDGTLTPIIDDHTRALLADDMRAAIAALAAHCAVTIISGRDLAGLKAKVGLDTVFHAGSHGFEIAAPAGAGEGLEIGAEFLRSLDEAERELQSLLAGLAGHSVERKKYSIAVHYRNVAPGRVGEIEAAVDRVLGERPGLKIGHGKKVLEVRPGIDWDKGRATHWILQRLGLDHSGAIALYVGDDLTDEDAFQALAGHGLCIAVRHDESRQTAADYVLDDTEDVRRFLEWLAELLLARAAPAGSSA